MKIVNKKQFLELPNGTLFTKYEPMTFTGLMIKTSTIKGNDFTYDDLIDVVDCGTGGDYIDNMEKMEAERVSFTADYYCTSRDGLYDENQMYGIYERDDVENLIQRLQEALEESTRED